jgi:cation:H+ antiporter
VTAWAIFVVSAAVIIYAGAKLSLHGDRIAKITGVGGLWIGVVLMAAATSLPEIITDVSAALIDAPDLAAGDLFGSSMANMLILGIIDLLHRQKRVWQHAATEHSLTAGLALLLTALATFLVLSGAGPSVLGVGLGSTLLVLLYLLGMRVVFRQETMKQRERRAAAAEEEKAGALRRSVIGFSVAAGALLVAGPFLASSANTIAEQTGISSTFIGATLLGITTSLPELATAVAAVRLGAFDLAVGNLFGSNAFNMAAFFFVDVAYRRAPLFDAVDEAHALTAVWSMLLMAIGLMGIVYRAERRFLMAEPDSLLMIAAYALGLWLLFP